MSDIVKRATHRTGRGKARWAVLLALLLAVAAISPGQAAEEPEVPEIPELVPEGDDIVDELDEGDIFEVFSNNLTHPDPESPEAPFEGITAGYEMAAENDHLVLYVNEENLGIKIENKATGFIWSGTSDQDLGDMHQSWQGLKDSAVTVDYQSQGRSGRASVTTGSARTELTALANGFEAAVRLRDTGFEFILRVTLEGSQVIIELPGESLTETKDAFRLTRIYVYPFLGSSYEDEVEGYFFVPDGSGALIRLGPNPMITQPYQGRIYGEDLSIHTPPAIGENLIESNQIRWPIWGAAHGPGGDAFLSVVESGQEYGMIEAYTSGITTAYNWITASYRVRDAYFQATNQRGEGFTLLQQQGNPVDIRIRLAVLNGEEADYVGMAKAYRSYLDAAGRLPEAAPAEFSQRESIPLMMKTFIGETRSALIGRTDIAMTSGEDLRAMTARLKTRGITHPEVLITGWQQGGTRQLGLDHGRPFSGAGIDRALYDDLQAEGVPLYYQAEYFRAFEETASFGSVNDGAQRITEAPVSLFDPWIGSPLYYISPRRSLAYLQDELDMWDSLGQDGLYLGNIASAFYADYNQRQALTRLDSTDVLQEFLAAVPGRKLISNPYDFMLAETDVVLDTPTSHSGYMSFTDNVPFVQIVLAGRIPMYSEDINFNASDQTFVLRAIDYGVYPSYLLTQEDPVELLNTDALRIYTSRFESWEDHVVETWQTINAALAPVQGQRIVSRDVPEDRTARVVYENGVTILVNYSTEDIQIDGALVPALDYLVTEAAP